MMLAGERADLLREKRAAGQDLNRFMVGPPPPDSAPTGQFGPDGREIPTLPGDFAQRVVPEQGFKPTGPSINVATGEVTTPTPPIAQPLPERFEALLNSPLSDEAKAQGIAEMKAEAAALAEPEQELDRDMRLAAFKEQLGRTTGPKDTSGADVTNNAIGRALPLIGDFTTGFGAYLKGIPGTDAKVLNNLLETVKANIGFDKLQAMREASPTGGALGQVSNQELSALQGVFGNLDQANNASELKYNLKLLQNIYNNIVHGEGNHSFPHPDDQTQASGQPPARGATPADIEAMRQQIIRKTALEEARATERRESAERRRDQAPALPPSTDQLIEDLGRQQGADAFRPPMGSQ
tara:strand:- start:46 stop:1101 length:1056 start_codon:yes stop_codon:yes gene_type:complete